MGTNLGVLIAVENETEAERAQTDLVSARAIYVRLEKIFSRFDPASELSLVNTHLNQSTEVSQEFLSVARKSLDWYETTDGLFDPRIIGTLESIGYARDFKLNDFSPVVSEGMPGISGHLKDELQILGEKIMLSARVDFSGIVKGYATDVVAAFLKQRGWKNFLVDSGGDIYAAGRPPETDKWNISIEGVDEQRLRFALSERAIATSGISRRKWEREGRRFHHLIHPAHTDDYSFDLRTATVVATFTEEADVLAKTLFIQNDEDRKRYAREKNIAVTLLYYSGTVWISPKAKEYVEYR